METWNRMHDLGQECKLMLLLDALSSFDDLKDIKKAKVISIASMTGSIIQAALSLKLKNA